MKKIPLTQNKYALVDDGDYEYLSEFKWYYQNTLRGRFEYANRYIKHKGNKRQTILSMHRDLLQAKRGQYCDHVDGNGLNNRRNNIRLCTQSQNRMNSKARSNNLSNFKGVSWHKQSKRWQVYILNKYIGLFDSKEAAAKEYNKQAKKHFREFAKLNLLL